MDFPLLSKGLETSRCGRVCFKGVRSVAEARDLPEGGVLWRDVRLIHKYILDGTVKAKDPLDGTVRINLRSGGWEGGDLI